MDLVPPDNKQWLIDGQMPFKIWAFWCVVRDQLKHVQKRKFSFVQYRTFLFPQVLAICREIDTDVYESTTPIVGVCMAILQWDHCVKGDLKQFIQFKLSTQNLSMPRFYRVIHYFIESWTVAWVHSTSMWRNSIKVLSVQYKTFTSEGFRIF